MSDVLTDPRQVSNTSAEQTPALVLVVDFGAQYAQLIARRVREARIFSEIVPHTMPVSEMLARNPAAVILSGGPQSVYAPGAPSINRDLFDAGVPVLGICYGFQVMAQSLGGEVGRTGESENGRTAVSIEPDALLLSSPALADQDVWMSHGDGVVKAPPGFRVTAATPGAPIAAFENRGRRLFGVQWHPEVKHTTHGQDLLEQFLRVGAGIEPDWTTSGIIENTIKSIEQTVGSSYVIAGLSGGVDSAVAAALVQRAVGDQLTCVFVDHGLLRAGEAEQVEEDFVKATGVKLKVVNARKRFLDALADETDPEQKRLKIGELFIRVFEEASDEIIAAQPHREKIEFLVQGTLYPDVVESGGGSGTETIKSHHNVGGLPDDIEFKLIEPLRSLFKDEVRAIGLELGLPEEIVFRHPFPGPGLAIRIVGPVTEENLAILRRADAIAREELTRADLDRTVWQFPVVLLADVSSVGVSGDGRTYEHPVVLRPVSSDDAMTADWSRLPYEVIERISTRITNEVDGVNRVVLDVTSKPPGTIEWQ